MAPRQPLNDEQRRLLRITARMPLASVANLASGAGNLDEEKVRSHAGPPCAGAAGLTSVVRGMTERRRQHRWFLTRQAVDLLYVTDHQHPCAQGGGKSRRAGRLPPRGRTARGLPGAVRPGPRPSRPPGGSGQILLSPEVR